MTPEKEQEILNIAPIFYQKHKLSCKETCMCWGIECNDAWFQPIMDMSKQIEFMNHTIARQCGFEIQASQIKSKYGILTVYIDVVIRRSAVKKFILNKLRKYRLLKDKDTFISKIGFKISSILMHNEYILSQKKELFRDQLFEQVGKIIIEAQDRCMNICEDCGKIIGTNDNPTCVTLGWVSYVCEKCAIKQNEEYVKNGKKFYNGEITVEKTK